VDLGKDTIVADAVATLRGVIWARRFLCLERLSTFLLDAADARASAGSLNLDAGPGFGYLAVCACPASFQLPPLDPGLRIRNPRSDGFDAA
jgi:hypothetical protein